MTTRGAPEGNKNAANGMECRQALKRALAHKSKKTYRDGLDMVMNEYVEAACDGESWAIRDMIDRLDGKPAQSMQLSGPDGSAMEMKWSVEVIEVTNDDNTDTE